MLIRLCAALSACLPLIAEPHLANIRQLTEGGQNAEAYWAPDGKRLIFQSTRPGWDCDQIYIMNDDGSGQRLVSTGKGRMPAFPNLTSTEDPTTKQLTKQYGIVGVPTIVFLDSAGNEVRSARLSGFEPPEQFLDRAKSVK